MADGTIRERIYKFHFRRGYDSENYLLEFITGVEDGNFWNDLFDAMKEINPVVAGHADLWMNDEILITINSTLGSFTFSKDIWNFAFIMENNNQPCLLKINELLSKDFRFEKIEVDPAKYT